MTKLICIATGMFQDYHRSSRIILHANLLHGNVGWTRDIIVYLSKQAGLKEISPEVNIRLKYLVITSERLLSEFLYGMSLEESQVDALLKAFHEDLRELIEDTKI